MLAGSSVGRISRLSPWSSCTPLGRRFGGASSSALRKRGISRPRCRRLRHAAPAAVSPLAVHSPSLDHLAALPSRCRPVVIPLSRLSLLPLPSLLRPAPHRTPAGTSTRFPGYIAGSPENPRRVVPCLRSPHAPRSPLACSAVRTL